GAERVGSHRLGQRERVFGVALGAPAFGRADDREARDVRSQDLEQPARMGALLEAQVLVARDARERVDERLTVPVDDALGELLAARVEHDERAACFVNIESDISVHWRPPGWGESWCLQQQLFVPRLEGATLSARFQATRPCASPT